MAGIKLSSKLLLQHCGLAAHKLIAAAAESQLHRGDGGLWLHNRPGSNGIVDRKYIGLFASKSTPDAVCALPGTCVSCCLLCCPYACSL